MDTQSIAPIARQHRDVAAADNEVLSLGIELDYVELYVADIEIAAAEFVERYGFVAAAHAGSDELGFRSIALVQGQITLVLTQGIAGEHPAKGYVLAHGDGVADIALRTKDARAAFAQAVARGARPVAEPVEHRSDDGTVVCATVAGFGDVVHTFVQRDAESGALPAVFTTADQLTATPGPGQTPTERSGSRPSPGTQPCDPQLSAGLLAVDHFAICVPAHELDATVEFYLSVLGFRQIFSERIEVGAQAMDSKVVKSPSGSVTFTVIAPDPRAVPGQIDAFLERHRGAGVQHVAFSTHNAVGAVRALIARGVEFLPTPSAYYTALQQRVALTAHTVDEVRALGLLVDTDHGGQLFQIFTRSTHRRRTLFFEVIERLGAETFGSANIKALYDAVEEDRRRGRSL